MAKHELTAATRTRNAILIDILRAEVEALAGDTWPVHGTIDHLNETLMEALIGLRCGADESEALVRQDIELAIEDAAWKGM